jgi:VacB/RNase II family 3'-5' exoribonuclease
MTPGDQQDRAVLRAIARRAMLERGLLPDFPPAVAAELERLTAPATAAPPATAPPSAGAGPSATAGPQPAEGSVGVSDLRHLLWCSIDNDESKDLDQLTVADAAAGGRVQVRVAVADVDALVTKATAIDQHAAYNTTSVYTAAQIFPMLPEKLSTGLTSLNLQEERLALVFSMLIASDGSLESSDVCRAAVRSRAKLAYNGVAAWLEGTGPTPAGVAAVGGLAENLRLQDQVAQRMKDNRHVRGALSLETIEARPRFEGDLVSGIAAEEKNRAKTIIEDFMIAANGVAARFLASRGSPSIRRVVRTPDRWDRIADIAAEHGVKLPGAPDAVALEKFLATMRSADPVRFPDLSLAVIKLLGPGEYVADLPGEDAPGHFGLAVKDYGHSTAPNRRFTDLITQRLLKAALAGERVPYQNDELAGLASHCTKQEDAANKVERQVGKSAAALFLRSQIGRRFEGMVTGAADKGTWVRLLEVPVEGRVVEGFKGLDVGHRVEVQLVSVDVDRGYIDFRRVGKQRPFAA